jgi:hypothetical protein
MNTAIEINSRIKELAETKVISTNDISDGYHTFGELYQHRIAIFIALAKQTGFAWRTKKHSDGSSWDGWFVLGIFKKAGEQMTYHLPISEWDKCYFADTLDKAPDFDGHTSTDVLERLTKLL